MFLLPGLFQQNAPGPSREEDDGVSNLKPIRLTPHHPDELRAQSRQTEGQPG